MKRNRKNHHARPGTNMSQVSHNHYHYHQTDKHNAKMDSNFCLAMAKSMQDFFDRFLSGQRLHQIQQMTQQQDYFEMYLEQQKSQQEQQKSNWQEFLNKLNIEVEPLTPNTNDLN